MPLTFAGIGQTRRIMQITGKDEVRQHLANLGFIAGEDVTVVSELGGSLIIGLKGSRVALDKAMAGRILIG